MIMSFRFGCIHNTSYTNNTYCVIHKPITALTVVQVETVDEALEYLVLASDGLWDSLTNQVSFFYTQCWWLCSQLVSTI